MSAKPSASLPQQRGPASTIAPKSAWANGPPRSTPTLTVPSSLPTSPAVSTSSTESFLASSHQELPTTPVTYSPQPQLAKSTKDKSSRRTASVTSPTIPTATLPRHSSSPHAKSKGRINILDEPVGPNGEASPERLSLHPTKKKEKETGLVPICPSSPDALSPDAGEHMLPSMLGSLPSSNGVMKPITQDPTHSTPSITSIARGAVTMPSTLPTGGGTLTADAPAFVPRRAIVIKNSSGEEVDLHKLGLPTSSTATTDSGTTAPMPVPVPVPKATEEEEEKQRRRQLAIMEVRKRAEEEARKKTSKDETMAVAKTKAEEEREGKDGEEGKAEEEARRQAEADAEKEALLRRIQEQETELALLRAKLAAQSQPLQMPPVAGPSLQASGDGEGDQESDHERVMSSTGDTCGVIYSENAVQHDEPEAEEEESQGEKEQEKHHDWSADQPHEHEHEHSYFPITVGPLTAPPASPSAQQQQQQDPSQPPQKMVRERSRRGGRRDRNRAAHADKGEKGDDVANPLKLQKSRSHEPRKRAAPVQLELSTMQRSRTLHPTRPSVLSSAKSITDITIVVYPAGVRTPKPELNEQSRNGPFRYDREFLMQFMSVCKQKPDYMADITEIGLEPEEQPQRTPSKRGSRRSRRSNAPATPTTPSFDDTLVPPTPSTDKDAKPNLSISPATPTVIPIALSRTSSRGARSRRSSAAPRLSPVDTLNPPIPITRSASHGSRAAPVAPLLSPLDRRSKSLKPRRRSESMKQDAPPVPSIPSDISSMVTLSAGHDVKPLETSANRWIPSSLVNRGHHSRGAARSGVSVQEADPPETIERKVKALLNKLTMEKFDSISDQIVAWANKSETEVDGATLQFVIKLVFEKATDEATWSHMYARLCRKMMEHVSSDVRDENVKDKHGNLVAGGQLFRQYLLSRCQADFERGWTAREDLEEKQEAVVAASGAAPGEIVFSDEYYALQKAKRRGLGLVKFIGELFKLQMLTERIMHRCIQRLLDEPAEEDIESACQLLITVGSALSGPKGKDMMDLSFEKMKEFAADHAVSSRIRFMLQDVIELRARDWIPRNQTAAPTTLAEVHEAAAKEKEAAPRLIPISRNSSRRGNNRGGDHSLRENTTDGWSSARSLGRAAALTLSINSILSPPKDDKSVSRTPTLPRSATSNMFHSLARNPSDSGSSRTLHTLTRNTSESGSARHAMTRNPSDSGLSRGLHSMNRNPSESGSSRNTHTIARVPSESGLTRMARNPSEPGKSRTSSRRDSNRRRPSTDFDQLNAVADSGSVGRRKLQLLPRSVGVPVASSVDPTEDSALGVTMEEPEPLPSMSESQVRARVEEDIKELFQIRDLTEGIAYFETLPGEYRYLLVDKLVSKIDAKEFDVVFIEKLFARVVDAGACDGEMFERGFASTMTFLDDISVDVPTAYAVITRLLLAAKLSNDAIGRLANSITDGGNPSVRPSEKLWEQYRILRQEEND